MLPATSEPLEIPLKREKNLGPSGHPSLPVWRLVTLPVLPSALRVPPKHTWDVSGLSPTLHLSPPQLETKPKTGGHSNENLHKSKYLAIPQLLRPFLATLPCRWPLWGRSRERWYPHPREWGAWARLPARTGDAEPAGGTWGGNQELSMG